MASFTTRVELHKASQEIDYKKLHAEMELEGFLRTIISDDNITYHLPTAEYNKIGNFTRQQILDSAKKAAAKTGKEHSILVTESNGRTWYNLEKV
ncbi:hypothetical protein [Mucilaginibacter sp.]